MSGYLCDGFNIVLLYLVLTTRFNFLVYELNGALCDYSANTSFVVESMSRHGIAASIPVNGRVSAVDENSKGGD